MPQPLRIENRASFVRKKYRFPTYEDLETSGAQYRKFKSKAKRAGKTIQEYYEQDKIKFEKREDERANRADWKGGEWKPADKDKMQEICPITYHRCGMYLQWSGLTNLFRGTNFATVQEYFGSEVALYFMWIQFYNKK